MELYAESCADVVDRLIKRFVCLSVYIAMRLDKPDISSGYKLKELSERLSSVTSIHTSDEPFWIRVCVCVLSVA